MRAGPDPSLVDARDHPLYRIGGIAFILTGVAYAVCLQLTLRLPASSGDAAAARDAALVVASLVVTVPMASWSLIGWGLT